MHRFAVALGIGLAGATIIAGCMLAWGASPPVPGSVEFVLYAQGSFLQVPGLVPGNFTLGGEGGILVGSIHWDHTSVVLVVGPLGSLLSCPIFGGYAGSAWNQSFNRTLSSGTFGFGAFCGGFGNGTVTQAVEVVYP